MCDQRSVSGLAFFPRRGRRPLGWALVWLGAVVLLALPLRAQQITPEPLPQLSIPNFGFPENEAALTSWVTAMTRSTPEAAFATAKIYLHGWGLWTALTAETAQSVDSQPLRVFETWLTPEELAADPATGVTAPAARLRRRSPLRSLNQLRFRLNERETSGTPDEIDPINRVMGFVKFDPTAADHIVKQQLLNTEALDALLLGGAQQIPAFPATALVAKPVFQVVKVSDLIDGRYYALKVWPGPPATPQPWAPSQWPGCVWLDVFDGGNGHGAVDESPAGDGSSRTEETTYPLASIIHYRLSATDAVGLNEAKPATDASAGDYAILVAMHVAGREIARWTWQTFWWTPTPDDPHEPSSPAIAGRRPAQLRGAARNYAMALAYTLLTPDQPYVGGENTGVPVYAYNPWIEARFGPADLPDSQPLPDASGRMLANNVGVQTNCMSCHIRATYNPNLRATAPRFAGARYTDLGDAQFVGTLQVDFLWSLPRNAQAPAKVFPNPQPITLP
jgi:hypothetical protein